MDCIHIHETKSQFLNSIAVFFRALYGADVGVYQSSVIWGGGGIGKGGERKGRKGKHEGKEKGKNIEKSGIPVYKDKEPVLTVKVSREGKYHFQKMGGGAFMGQK
jgi:hypothetical protein